MRAVFIAPVMPLLHDDPKPIAETMRIDKSLNVNGTSTKDETSLAESFETRSAWIDDSSLLEAGTSTTAMADASLAVVPLMMEAVEKK